LLNGFQTCLCHSYLHPDAKFVVPDWGDIVDSDIGLSCRSDRLHRLAGRYDNQPQDVENNARAETHFKRQATRHDRLPILQGDGEKLIVYGEEIIQG
jgi:hypothetical protein